MQVSFLFGALARKFRENLWFDYKRFEVWLVNTGNLKTKGVGKLDSFENIPWKSSAKADKYSGCYLFLSLSEQVAYFQETDYCINWVIIYSFFQSFFKIGVLKTFYTIQRKTTVPEFLFNQLVTCYVFNKRNRNTLLWILRNCQERHFYKNTLRPVILHLWNI